MNFKVGILVEFDDFTHIVTLKFSNFEFIAYKSKVFIFYKSLFSFNHKYRVRECNCRVPPYYSTGQLRENLLAFCSLISFEIMEADPVLRNILEMVTTP